jgi:hypothetical protein
VKNQNDWERKQCANDSYKQNGNERLHMRSGLTNQAQRPGWAERNNAPE